MYAQVPSGYGSQQVMSALALLGRSIGSGGNIVAGTSTGGMTLNGTDVLETRLLLERVPMLTMKAARYRPQDMVNILFDTTWQQIFVRE